MKMKTLTATFVALLLAACGADDSRQRYEKIDGNAYEVGNKIMFVYEVHLRDGTRCVANYRGGIACDWKQPEAQ